MLQITIEGESYEFNEDRLMISEVIVLKKVTGLTPDELFEGLRSRTCTPDTCKAWKTDGDAPVPCEVDEHKMSMDFEAVKAVCWLAVRRAKGADTPRYSEFDFDLSEFDMAEVMDEDELTELLDEAATDPTSAAEPASEKASKPS